MMNARIENFGKVLGGVSGYPMIGGKMKGIERYSIYSRGKEDRETGIYLIIHIFSARIHGHLLCASHFSDTDDTVANKSSRVLPFTELTFLRLYLDRASLVTTLSPWLGKD